MYSYLNKLKLKWWIKKHANGKKQNLNIRTQNLIW